MQLQMFWALFMHAQDAQEIRDDPAAQKVVWDGLRDMRKAGAIGAVPAGGRRRCAWWPTWKRPCSITTTVAPTTTSGRASSTTTSATGTANADVPGTFHRRLVRSLFRARCAAHFRGDGPAKQVGPAAHHRPVDARGHARRHVGDRRRWIFGPRKRLGRAPAYFEEQLRVVRALVERRADEGRGGNRRWRIFVMGGGQRPTDAAGQARSWRTLARRARMARLPARAGRRTTSTVTAGCHREAATAGAAPRSYTFDPEHPVPTLGGSLCGNHGIAGGPRRPRPDVGALSCRR